MSDKRKDVAIARGEQIKKMKQKLQLVEKSLRKGELAACCCEITRELRSTLCSNVL